MGMFSSKKDVAITIRCAVIEDVPAIIEMGTKFYAASKCADVIAGFDPGSFEVTVQRMMVPESGGLILLAMAGDQPAGMAGVLIYPCFFNLQILFAQEVFYWVEPQHRGHGGPVLLDGLEVVCKGLGANVMILAATSGLRDKALAELYARRGYRAGENSFVKAL